MPRLVGTRWSEGRGDGFAKPPSPRPGFDFLGRGGRIGVSAALDPMQHALGVKSKGGISVDLGTGWLAREGKVYFDSNHGSVQVGIRR